MGFDSIKVLTSALKCVGDGLRSQTVSEQSEIQGVCSNRLLKNEERNPEHPGLLRPQELGPPALACSVNNILSLQLLAWTFHKSPTVILVLADIVRGCFPLVPFSIYPSEVPHNHFLCA